MVRTFRCPGCGAINRVPDGRSGKPVCGRCKNELDTSGGPQEVDGKAFQAAVDSAPVPVLVDFWAPWCGPCRMAAPLLDRVGREHAGSLLVLKVNSDENPELSSRYRISGIPAFLIFKGGREVGRQMGLPAPAAFARWIEQTAR